MAISTDSMLLKLSPMQGIDPVGAIQQAQQMSAQRQQMRLARERFEEEKRRAEEQKQLSLLEERGRMAREQMQQERLRAEKQQELQAQQQAALLAQQQAALGKVGELAGTGKTQQLAAQSPLLDQLGFDQNYLGSVGGLPVYDFVNRQKAQEQEDQQFEQAPRAIEGWDGQESATQSLNRMEGEGLGYPDNERGNLEDGTGASRSAVEPGSEPLDVAQQVGGLDEATSDALSPGEADLATAEQLSGGGGEEPADVSVGGRGLGPASLAPGDPFARALAADRYAQETGKPARGPDEEDFMGAVPRNRIDMPAMAAETLRRLNPALDARVASMPPELRDAARANAAAIGGLGLEATDALAEQDKAMQDPVSIYNSQQNLLAEKEKRQTPSMMDVSTYRTRGAKDAQKLAKDRGVVEVLKAVKSADVALLALDDDDPNNDTMIAPALMDAQGVKGVPSNTDLEYAIGLKKGSAITQIIARVQELLVGGMSDPQKAAIRKYLKIVQDSQKGSVRDYLNNAFERLDSGELNEHEARGYKGAVEESVPAWMYNDYWKEREKAGTAGPSARAGQNAPAAAGELQRQAARAGLNGQVLGQLMGGESGGDPKAANENRTDGLPKSSAKGAFQMIDSTAQAMGFKDAADYSSRPLDEQIDAGLKLFKNKGLTKDSAPEDYALVMAAPSKVGKWKSRDDVVYEKGSAEWAGNPGWRSAGDGPATVGSITDYYLRAGKQRVARSEAEDRAAAGKAEPSNPYPDNPKAKRALDLLEKL